MFTYSGGTGGLYKNGIQIGSGATMQNPANWNGFLMQLTGSGDEVRVSNIARSADWIATQYNNQNAPGTLYAIGAQEGPGGGGGGAGWYNPAWTNRKAITINHNLVTSNLNDFPMLFSATNDANLRSVANGGSVGKSDGTDILFTSADGTTKLNH